MCIVAASGPSLNEDDAALCLGHRVVVVGDAYRLFPWADVLYACDHRWWDAREGTDFAGEKWISTDGNRWPQVLSAAKKYRLRIIQGLKHPFFSRDPKFIHYGWNSGYQAINLALHFGATTLVLLGFDFQNTNGKTHFFGDHARPLANTQKWDHMLDAMNVASKKLPPGVEIINCSPGSAIDCFPRRDLREVLNGLADSHAA